MQKNLIFELLSKYIVMNRVLGLDLGTNSIGWAIVERDENHCRLVDKGVHIFQEGVISEKGNEKPSVQTRTEARSSRRHYFRRRLRKIELLKILIKYDMCPELSDEQLDLWRYKKTYPLSDDFILWQRTDDKADKNPYAARYVALTEKLDFSVRENRFLLGRALYHLVQRRGFLSNRKDSQSSKADNDAGKVKLGIYELSEDMKNSGCEYIGEFFYSIYGKDKIRNRYTARNEHYLAEFEAICKKQQFPDDLRMALQRAIFFQRPLKSQKGTVGHCMLEHGKSRCQLSHPRYEEYRMLCFVNNIKVTIIPDKGSAVERQLTEDEIESIRPLFMRKSKPYFDFKEIAEKLAGKKYLPACKGDKNEDANMLFNFQRDYTVSGCPVTAGLAGIFGDDYVAGICTRYKKGAGKSAEQMLNDVWHAMVSFDDDVKLKNWAKTNLGLDDDEAAKFASIKIPQGYASLSLNAINKILVYLRRGFLYDKAVVLANLGEVMPAEIWENNTEKEKIIKGVCEVISDFKENPINKDKKIWQCVEEYLLDSVNVEFVSRVRLENLYLHSGNEVYKHAEKNNGVLQLGSPRLSALRNPMAMRALFRLRALINELLRSGKIDSQTTVNIELARELNSANLRKAIKDYQKGKEKKRREYEIEIRELYLKEAGRTIEPTEDDILKFMLWQEQKHVCLYTGSQINLEDFIGADPKFDIEHTIPRSRGGDDSMMNKTLCDRRFNRDVKKTMIPAELTNYKDVLVRLKSFKDRISEFESQLKRADIRVRAAVDKETKDRAISGRMVIRMELDYLKDKYGRFLMKEVPDGFRNSQGVNIGVIGKYAMPYLRTVFDRVFAVKGTTTAEFRKMWGLQDKYAKKERSNYVHHCIDAITVACIGREEYAGWAKYAVQQDEYYFNGGERPHLEKPWPEFTEDINAISEYLLVSHHTPDHMHKRSRKKMRIRGVVQKNADGKVKYLQGDTARGELHNATYYGAIERDGSVRYVIRKSLGDLTTEKDVDKIVDDVVRKKVREAVELVGFKKAISNEYIIWMNEPKQIPVKKVRLYADTVKSPIKLKPHRDLSVKEYKQTYNVMNSGNYCMAIYEGYKKGKQTKTFRIINNLEAAKLFKVSGETGYETLVPGIDENGHKLKCVLKTGTMVLFYENSPRELYECDDRDLAKRLYKVTIMSILKQENNSYGRFTFRHCQEARPAEDLKAKNGKWKIGEPYRPLITMLHTQLNAFVEGFDFDMSITGEIKFKHNINEL